MRHFLLALGAVVAALLLQLPAIGQMGQPGASGQPGEGQTETGKSEGRPDGAAGANSYVSGGPATTNGTGQKASSNIGIDEEIEVDTEGGTGAKTTATTPSTGTTTPRRSTGASATSSRARSSGTLATSSDIPVIILMPNTAVAATSPAETAFSDVQEEQAETAPSEKAQPATRSDSTKPTATRSVARFAGILIVIAAGYLLLRQPKTR